MVFLIITKIIINLEYKIKFIFQAKNYNWTKLLISNFVFVSALYLNFHNDR